MRRRRATFILNANQQFDPSEVQLKGRKFLYPGLKAAREERITLKESHLNEFSKVVADHFNSTQHLHIRWIPETSPGSITPFGSRLTPGLHVHLEPYGAQSLDWVCNALKTAFSPDLKCDNVNTSFSEASALPQASSSPSSWQYYSLLPSLNHFVAYGQRNICTPADQQCPHNAALLNIVDYLDIDYDRQKEQLIITAFWSKHPPAIYDPIGELTTLDQWPMVIEAPRDQKVEIGILSSSPATDPQDILLGGFLTVVGESDKPKGTQFSFPSRHHILPRTQATKQAYTVSFQKPTGLHPILSIQFPSLLALEPPTTAPASSTCALHSYFTLPSSIFADEYAFKANDPLFEQSHNLRALNSINGELDLEAPDYVVQKWGSTMLLELATPDSTTTPVPDRPWTVTVPLHLRYLPPAENGFDKVRVPWPVVFWACSADPDTKFSGNPFDRVNLGYDALFDENTLFYHLRPAPKEVNEGRLVEEIAVPVLATSSLGGDSAVEMGTLVVILLGFAWVLFKLWPGMRLQMGLGGTHGVKGKCWVEKKTT